MKVKYMLMLMLFSLSIISADAQGNKDGAKKKFDVEGFRKKKAEFIKAELNLTDTEEKAFIPLVNELMQKKYRINKAVREAQRLLEEKKVKTEADYQSVTDAILDARIKETQLQKEYFQKFNGVLSAEKIYKFQQAEMKFAKKAVEQYRGKDGNARKNKK